MPLKTAASSGADKRVAGNNHSAACLVEAASSRKVGLGGDGTSSTVGRYAARGFSVLASVAPSAMAAAWRKRCETFFVVPCARRKPPVVDLGQTSPIYL